MPTPARVPPITEAEALCVLRQSEAFTFWRTRERLTLWQAAALLCTLDPSLRFDSDHADDRAARERIRRVIAELCAEADGGRLRVFAYDFAATDSNQHAQCPFPTFPEPGAKYGNPELATIATDDLRAWCKIRKLNPVALFPPKVVAPSIGDSDLEAQIRTLRAGWNDFWARADRDDKTSWPATTKIVKWFRRQQGFASDNRAQAAAAIIRPSWAGGGRKPKS